MVRLAAGFVLAGLLVSAVPSPASAQGFFERLFGGIRRAVEAPDPFTSLARAIDPPTSMAPVDEPRMASSGPSRGFCVRTCDGHYFPVRSQGDMSAAETCNSFCPAATTKVFGGSTIDTATANDGTRYTDLPNAFAYRQKVVSNCTCNGKTPFGLATMDINQDQTLRPGDVVVTKSGLVAYNGGRNSNVADFTPVENYRGFSRADRERLSAVRIMPPSHRGNDTTASIDKANIAQRVDDGRTAKLTR